ncbi:MAG: hypothetical protein PSX81_03265 [bacterium]|nr:hypothetical protein [bacterium]
MKPTSQKKVTKPLLTRIAEQLVKDQQELDHLAVQLSLGKAEVKDKFESLKEKLKASLHAFKVDLKEVYNDNKEWSVGFKEKLTHLEEQLSASKAETKEVFKAQKKNILQAMDLVKEEIKANPEVHKASDFFTAASENARLQIRLFEMKWGSKEKVLTGFRAEMKKASEKVDEIIAEAKSNKQKAEVKLQGFNTEIHEAYNHFKKAIKSL